ncbi:MAG: hypothetical protein J3Q66DRAFT_341415 [Benniella sp.]|nr:MAG: hypothetical protein J3Q66DRAFT_341415 [Benniella sp.]
MGLAVVPPAMSSCEATLFHSLEEILGPTLAETVGKSITELVPAASICILSQSIGKIGGELAGSVHSTIENLANASTDKVGKIGGELAGSIHSTIENLANATTDEDRKHWIGILFALLVAALGAYLAPIFLQLIVQAMGFTKGGIAANSLASWIMTTYGGHVTVGSFCAVLQSMGAAGLGAGGAALTSLAGAAAGWWAGSEFGGAGDFFNVKDKVEQLWGSA